MLPIWEDCMDSQIVLLQWGFMFVIRMLICSHLLSLDSLEVHLKWYIVIDKFFVMLTADSELHRD